MTDTENLPALPEKWCWTTLGDIIENSDGRRIPIKRSDREKVRGKYPYFGASGIIDYVNDFLFDGDFLLIGEDGANLLSRSTPIAFQAHKKFWVNNHAHVMKTLVDIPLEFLEAYVNSIDLTFYVTGTAQPKLTQANLNKINVPLPPLPEQHRIVQKIEELFTDLDAGVKELENAKMRLKHYRQSILNEASDGRMTKEWRERNSNVETAESRWHLSVLPLQSNKLPKIPPTWVYRSLQDVSERVSVGHVGPTSEYYCDKSSGVPFIRSQNVRPGLLDLNGVQYISREFHEKTKKSQLKIGDLLIVRVGANRGDSCIVPNLNLELNCANIVFSRPRKDISKYLNIYFQTERCKGLMLGMSTGSAQGVINTKSVAKVAIPIPPLEEQKIIISEIERRFSVIDQIERIIDQSLIQADKLRQSILKMTPSIPSSFARASRICL